MSYDDDVHPYSDLVLGRVDAVLLDNVLAERRRRFMPGFHDPASRQSRSATTSASSRHRTPPCATRCNEILRGAMRDGSLERIFRKWNVWNDDQPPLHARLLAGDTCPPSSGSTTRQA